MDWVPVDTPFSKRFDSYLDPTFFEHQIHWFSIFNSFMMVIFLCGLVSLILVRTLKNDFAKVCTWLRNIKITHAALLLGVFGFVVGLVAVRNVGVYTPGVLSAKACVGVETVTRWPP